MARTDRPNAPVVDAPFLVLPENEFAHAAVSAVGKTPPTDGRLSPIYLYGPSGVGKTRLAQLAIEQFAIHRPGSRIEHITARNFAADFAESAAHGTIALFQAATREFDMFVIEDVHALEGRRQSQVQLLALYDELAFKGCQIISTSRIAPGELVTFPRKLVSRFRGGVSAQIRPPGIRSRAKLLLHFAETRQIRLEEEAARLLAKNLAVSPRELAASLAQLHSMARNQLGCRDSELVRKYLKQEIPPPKPRLVDVCAAVAKEFGLTSGQLRSREQSREIVVPRQCAMLAARRLTDRTLEDIGTYFGGRDHTTVLYACRRLANILPHAADLQFHFAQIEALLGVPTGTVSCETFDEEPPAGTSLKRNGREHPESS
jgi:chromosomal replication initiator protein